MGLTRPRAYQIYNLDYKQSVRVVTVSNITLTGGAPNTVDGVTLSLNDRVLVTGQSTGSQNGIYYVTTLGTGSNGTWARSIDTNETGELDSGTIVMVTEGTVYADTQWKLTTNDPIVIGSTTLTFVQNYSANSISSGTSNVVVNSNANVTISSAGTANVLVVTGTGANIAGTLNATGNATVGNITATIGNFTTFNSSQGGNVTGTLIATSANAQFFNQTNGAGYVTVAGYLTVAGNITGGNVISNAVVNATGNITGGNLTTAGQVVATGNITGGNVLGGVLYATTTTANTVTARLATGNDNNFKITAQNGVASNTTGTEVSRLGMNYVGTGWDSFTQYIRGSAAQNGSQVLWASNTAIANISSTGLAVTGVITATGNVTGGNLSGTSISGTLITAAQTNITSVGTLGSLTVTANVAGGNITTGAQVVATGNITGGNINTGAQVVATGNITGGNINTAGVVRATGIVSGSELTSTNASGSEGGQINLAQPASGSTLAGGITIDAYNNLLRFFEQGGTARGAYIDLTACATGVGTNLLAGGGGGTPGGSNTYVQFNDGGTFGGNGQFVYNKVTNIVTAGSFAANTSGLGTNYAVGDDGYIGDINTADTIGIKGVQSNGANAYIVFGNSDATGKLGRAGTGPLTYAGAFTATGNISGGNLSGTSISGTLITAAQTNITSVGTLGSLAVTGNTTSGNFIGTLNGSGANVTSISATNISSGTLAQARLANASVTLGSTALTLGSTVTTVAGLSSVTSTTFVGALSGAATTAGTVTTAAQPNITSVGTLSSLTVTGNITFGGSLVDTGALELVTGSNGNITLSPNGTGVIVANKDIRNGQANGVGNIGTVGGYFNTIFAKATSAQYADLAEMYVADASYPSGTVVEFGGEYEITQTTSSCSHAIAGIISTDPSYLMNSCQEGEHVLPVALTGRVPCQVLGPVRKGDVLISSNVPGVAQRIGANWQPGCTVGKAMENIDKSVIKTIEVAVGRL